MSSQVNPNAINPNFPVPGVNQSSSGFRTNFLAIQNSFKQYVSEMNDLMNKAIVSAPLTYGSQITINDFGGMLNSNLAFYNSGLKVWDYGDISVSTTEQISFANGAVQTFNLTASAGATQTINIIDFPGLGYSEVVLKISAVNPPQYLDLSSLVIGGNLTTSGNINISGFDKSTSNLTLTSTQPYIITLGSIDGINWILNLTSSAVAKTASQLNSIGNPGDIAGMISVINGTMYVCVRNFDGNPHCWQKVILNDY